MLSPKLYFAILIICITLSSSDKHLNRTFLPKLGLGNLKWDRLSLILGAWGHFPCDFVQNKNWKRPVYFSVVQREQIRGSKFVLALVFTEAEEIQFTLHDLLENSSFILTLLAVSTLMKKEIESKSIIALVITVLL